MSHVLQVDRPIFAIAVRWTLRVLTWLAFAVSAYLAWHAVNQTSVAGCGVGDQNACNEVLGSSWSKWLGIPVAVAGLACYASLAGLSVLLGMQCSPTSRWINTAFVMLATVATGGSLWFIALQLLVIGEICPFCLVADVCGIAIGALTLWSVGSWLYATRDARRVQHSATGLMALKTALPIGTGSRSSPAPVSRNVETPSLPIALSTALVLLVLLVAGQLLFPSKTFSLQTAALQQSIELTGSNQQPSSFSAESPPAQSYVTKRIESEPESVSDGRDNLPEGDTDPQRNALADESPADGPRETSEPSINGDTPVPPSADPHRERFVEFLGGKLTLDVYKHPLIGSPDAPHIMVELFSYDCPHCRKMHRLIENGLARYGNQLAVIMLPIPMEIGCNRLITDPAASHQSACATARMALGIAALRPTLFAKFHDWMMADEEKPPAFEKIIPKAYGLVDRDRLRPLYRDDKKDLKKQIAGYVDLYAQLRNAHGGDQKFGLPVQILGDHVMAGMAEKESDVFTAWEQHLGVTPP